MLAREAKTANSQHLTAKNQYLISSLTSFGKIPAMRNARTILIVLVGLFLLAALLYQIPPVKQRLSWRIDFALAFAISSVDAHMVWERLEQTK